MTLKTTLKMTLKTTLKKTLKTTLKTALKTTLKSCLCLDNVSSSLNLHSQEPPCSPRSLAKSARDVSEPHEKVIVMTSASHQDATVKNSANCRCNCDDSVCL